MKKSKKMSYWATLAVAITTAITLVVKAAYSKKGKKAIDNPAS